MSRDPLEGVRPQDLYERPDRSVAMKGRSFGTRRWLLVLGIACVALFAAGVAIYLTSAPVKPSTKKGAADETVVRQLPRHSPPDEAPANAAASSVPKPSVTR